jgi:ERCC4-type nuclease
MLIKIDTRENALYQQLSYLVSIIPVFKSIKLVVETLPIGDVIISDGVSEKLVIERKCINDLLSSIKDGRYEEQSYRLNGLAHHNHNIIYLIEGDVNKTNRFKQNNELEKLTLYSAMFSLNYYKGFSVFRSFSLEESALIICNMAYKMERDVATKHPYYYNIHTSTNTISTSPISPSTIFTEITTSLNEDNSSESISEESSNIAQDKDYISVVKKVKKENITPDNIAEIMLCQIPGISSVTAIAIMKQYQSLAHLVAAIETNNDCLKDVSYTNTKGQTRKINKTCSSNIVKFLLKK